MNPLSASLIIPTYNRGPILCAAIDRALAQDFQDLEIIVVDQTPRHAQAVENFLHEKASKFRLIRLSTPSVTIARNVGIRAATGDVIFFVDDDVVISENFVTSLMGYFQSSQTGGVMGLLLPATETNVERARADAMDLYEVPPGERQKTVVPVSWLAGSAVAYSRKALWEAGLFDEYFQRSAWCDDADMAVRVRGLGYALLLDKQVSVTHLESLTGGCGNRDPHEVKRIEREHMEFLNYFIVKNRRLFGVRRVARSLFRSYRNYVFNRAVAAAGWKEFIRRQSLYWQSVQKALRDSKNKMAVAHS